MAARINLSIPDDLKDRMDSQGEPVNWSQIAAQAFEKKLNQAQDAAFQEFANGVGEAATRPGDESLEYLVDLIRESRPELVDAVREDIGALFKRLDRHDIIEGLVDPEWKSEMPWPLDPEGLVKVIRKFVFGYHQRVVEPLFNQLVGEVVFLRLARLSEKNRA